MSRASGAYEKDLRASSWITCQREDEIHKQKQTNKQKTEAVVAVETLKVHSS